MKTGVSSDYATGKELSRITTVLVAAIALFSLMGLLMHDSDRRRIEKLEQAIHTGGTE